jgi:hypothetical protein
MVDNPLGFPSKEEAPFRVALVDMPCIPLPAVGGINIGVAVAKKLKKLQMI